MADEKAKTEVSEVKFAGVDVSHPSIVSTIRTGVKNGMGAEHLQKITGMPMEVVERHIRDAKKDG